MDHATLKNLVALGDLKSYEYVPDPVDCRLDNDDLIILEFPSGRKLHVSAFSAGSFGSLGVRDPSLPQP